MLRAARERAGISRETAAMLLHIGSRTLADYESYKTCTPPDVALRASQVYGDPTLPARYCKNQCPIGQVYAYEIDDFGIAETTLSLIAELNEANQIVNELISIARDGKITNSEHMQFIQIKNAFNQLGKAINQLQFIQTEKERQPMMAAR